MAHRLRAWWALPRSDKGRLLCCAIGRACIHSMLACIGYARTRRLVEAATHRNTYRHASPAQVEYAQALARMAAIAGRHGAVQATCLRQSLLLYGWLRRQGLQPQLHLGIADRNGPFQAHAWVELEGTPLLSLDTGHRAFAPVSA